MAKSAIELIREKHERNLWRFPPEENAKFHMNGELKQAAIFTLTKELDVYPDLWTSWYFKNVLREGDEVENLVNAAALICAEIDRLQKIKNHE